MTSPYTMHLTITITASQFHIAISHGTMRMCSSSLCLLFLLVALSALSAFADDVNIDCGSSTSYTDKNDVEWVGDGDYTKSGKSMKVSNLKSDHVMDTLQVFSTGKKNCYSVPSVSQQQVLVRASFYYGNYDKKSSPPTFDLLLEGNHWATVLTSSTQTVWYEAIYVVKGSSVDVCVSQTSATLIPFMSALEIRSMSTDMYKYFDTDTALIMRDRTFFSDPISSVLDSSGRIWDSISVPSTMIMATSEAVSIASSVDDNPPEEVLRHAVTVPMASHRIQITTENLPTTNVPVYMTLYFSEVTLLDSTTDQRSFNIYLDDRLVTDEPIIPVFGDVYEYTMYNFSANSSTVFYLDATAESTLPPLLNAFEVFTVIDTSAQTDGDDETTTPSGTTPADTTPSDDGTPTTTTTTTSTKKSSSSTSNGTKKKSPLPIILGTTIPAFAAFWAIVGLLARRHQKRKSAAIAAISNMGQGGGPNGAPTNAQGKDFVVQMTPNNNYTGEAVLLGRDHSTTVHDSSNGHDSD